MSKEQENIRRFYTTEKYDYMMKDMVNYIPHIPPTLATPRKIIKIISNDNVTFEIDRDIAFKHSELLKTMMSDSDEVEVNFATINYSFLSGDILHFIVKFMIMDDNDFVIKKPLISTNMKDNVNNKSYADYIDDIYVGDKLFEVLDAAEFMQVNSLINLCISKIASIIIKVNEASFNREEILIRLNRFRLWEKGDGVEHRDGKKIKKVKKKSKKSQKKVKKSKRKSKRAVNL
jgi:hypothetical protein